MRFYEPVDLKEPVDYLEPERDENPYREASLGFLRIISLATSYILESSEPVTATWGVAFALGLISVTENRTMRQVARDYNLSSGTISNHAKKFGRIAGLPPSALMQDESRVKKSREARNNFCQSAFEEKL